jgi:hypothetical protein
MLGFPEHVCPSLTASHSDEPFLTSRRIETRVLASEYVSIWRELDSATYVLMVAVDLEGILTVAAGVSRE